jgi:hypothetical protein
MHYLKSEQPAKFADTNLTSKLFLFYHI